MLPRTTKTKRTEKRCMNPTRTQNPGRETPQWRGRAEFQSPAPGVSAARWPMETRRRKSRAAVFHTAVFICSTCKLPLLPASLHTPHRWTPGAAAPARTERETVDWAQQPGRDFPSAFSSTRWSRYWDQLQTSETLKHYTRFCLISHKLWKEILNLYLCIIFKKQFS